MPAKKEWPKRVWLARLRGVGPIKALFEQEQAEQFEATEIPHDVEPYVPASSLQEVREALELEVAAYEAASRDEKSEPYKLELAKAEGLQEAIESVFGDLESEKPNFAERMVLGAVAAERERTRQAIAGLKIYRPLIDGDPFQVVLVEALEHALDELDATAQAAQEVSDAK